MNTFLAKLILIITVSSGTFNGTVLDQKTNESLTGVKVIVNNVDTLYTDFNGEFTVKSDSIKTISLEYISYENELINIESR